VSIEIAGRVLESLYDIWFKNYGVGYSREDLIRETGYEGNQINQAIQFLESNGLIISNYPRRYVVTTYGIDKREEMLSPALLAAKKQER
jgi:hypothetical protein